jgi:hypothetical protein
LKCMDVHSMQCCDVVDVENLERAGGGEGGGEYANYA